MYPRVSDHSLRVLRGEYSSTLDPLNRIFHLSGKTQIANRVSPDNKRIANLATYAYRQARPHPLPDQTGTLPHQKPQHLRP